MSGALSPLLLAVLAFFAVERALELAINARNTRRLAARGARWHGPRDGFALILAAQGVLFAGTVAEAALAPWGGEQPWTWPVLGFLVLAQALRYWCITTLGERWSIRVVTVSDAPRVSAGPYRWFPHPNYLAVMMEAIALPLAFGAFATLAFAAPLQMVAIWRRIRIEEAALREAGRQAEREAGTALAVSSESR